MAMSEVDVDLLVEEDLEPSQIRRYYTPTEVALHNTKKNCWLSWFGKVYNLTQLLAEYDDAETLPIVQAAGTDITHWFSSEGKLKTYKHPFTGLEIPFTPAGRFVHVPPFSPRSDWRNDFEKAWWQNEKFCIGYLTKKTRKIRVINTLTDQEHLIEVCSEETISEIMQRYLNYNSNADGYSWKRLGKELNLQWNLEQNGVVDEANEFQELDMEPHYPALHIYFKNLVDKVA